MGISEEHTGAGDIMGNRRGIVAIAAGAIAAGALGALTFGSCSTKDAGGEVVAKVNGSAIYAQDLELEVMRYQQGQAAAVQEAGADKEGDQRAEVLDMLIENELLFQEASRLGYAADAKEVEERPSFPQPRCSTRP